MKVEVECAACLLHRGYLEIKNATNDLSLQFKAMSALANLLSREFKPAAVPAVLGTERDRLVKRVTGNSDPYVKTKQLSNRRALEILPLVKSLISRESSTESEFRKACLCSIVGNVIEFDIPVHTFKFEDMENMIQRAEEDLAIDEIPRIFNAARKARSILYLTDNAGEIAFDTLFVHELKKLGAHVVVGVKDKPILNDATMADAEDVGMHKVADNVITTGTDTVGLIPEECSREFWNFYSSVDFVVAKGMGYLETISEFQSLRTAHAFLLRTKCGPVARFLGVDMGKNVAMLRDTYF